MRLSLLPSVMVTDLTEITVAFLRERRIRLLMLDFDNTILPYTTDDPTPPMAAWLETMKASDIQLCVVSNSHKQRVRIFCEKWGIPCIIKSRKPFPVGIPKCLKRFGIPAENAAIAGDQIFTDTLGGNLCGLTTILVKPIHNHNFWLKARHVLEQPFIYLARKRRI